MVHAPVLLSNSIHKQNKHIMETIWFDNWESLLRTMIMTAAGYGAMVIILRVSGKRTLSKMNAFDFIVTIALGSTLASIALNKNIPLANGVAAVFIFVFLQYLLTWISVRVKFFKTLITSKPTLIFYKGNYLHKAMKEERITVEEVQCAGRNKGYSTLDEIDMIILEATGEFTILETNRPGAITTFDNVQDPG